MGLDHTSAVQWVADGCRRILLLSGKTLIKEVKAVFEAVDRSTEEGRRQVARIVGRDTSNLSPQEIRAAALETLSRT